MKSKALYIGESKKDILSLLGESICCSQMRFMFRIRTVKANESENEKTRLTEEEMLAQMR